MFWLVPGVVEVRGRKCSKPRQPEQAACSTWRRLLLFGAQRSIPQANRSFGAYVRMLLVTGARRSELAAAQLDWISTGASQLPVLTLPPEITKNGRAHSIPLPPLAQKIAAEVGRHHSTGFLFPGGISRRSKTIVAISGWSKLWPALLQISRKYGFTGHATLHDLRKSARSHWSRIGIPTEVCEAMLNHTARSRLVAIYDLSDRLDQRIEALNSLVRRDRSGSFYVACRNNQTERRDRSNRIAPRLPEQETAQQTVYRAGSL